MKRSEATDIVAILVAGFPRREIGLATTKIYEDLLMDLDFEIARVAVEGLLKTTNFFPTVAEIRAACAERALGPVRLGGEAWAQALEAVRRTGAYDPMPTFGDDPLIAEALKLWGTWKDFCRSPEDDAPGRARFIDLYDQLAKRARSAAVEGKSVGQLLAARALRELPGGRK